MGPGEKVQWIDQCLEWGGTVMLLEMRQIRKSFLNVRALQGVDFTLNRGEVHFLLGENGAGKSTLMKILAGVHTPDAGEVRIEGQPVRFASPAEARAAGVRTIFQELSLIPDLTLAENLSLAHLPRGPLGLVRRREAEKHARQALDLLGCDLDPGALAGTLSLAEQQLVEIARAIAGQAKILIMDEPTAALTAAEAQRLFQVVRNLSRHGVGIIYISHRMEEIAQIATRISVLRDGCNAGSFPPTVPLDQLIEAMVGHQLAEQYPVEHRPPGEPVLEVRGLSVGVCRGLSFTVHRGEIVGVAGLLGSGMVELARCLFGVLPPEAGEVRIGGEPVRLRSPRAAIARGIGYVPEDRKQQGLILQHPVLHNVSLASLRHCSRFGLLQGRAERARAEELVRRLRIVTPSLDQSVQLLSGGNQQKVAVAKWLATRGRMVIFNEPTRGVDVGARAEIYRLMSNLTAEGYGILVLSSDLQEIAGIADRALVLRRGQIVGEVGREAADRSRLIALATGAAEGAGSPGRSGAAPAGPQSGPGPSSGGVVLP